MKLQWVLCAEDGICKSMSGLPYEPQLAAQCAQLELPSAATYSGNEGQKRMRDVKVQSIDFSTFARIFGMAIILILTLAEISVADIRFGDRSINGCDIHIFNKIERGDFEEFRELAQKYHQKDKLAYKSDISSINEVWPRTVCLDSPGGSYIEGANIALEVNNYFATKLLSGSACLSSCALIFMSGTLIHPDHVLYRHYEEACYSDCEGWTPEPSRTMSPSSVLGFHAPYVNFEGKTSLPIETVQEIIRSLLQVSAFLQSETKDNFPPELASAMMSKGPDEAYYVDEVGQLASWSINLEAGFRPTLDVRALKRAWIMYAHDYDHSHGGYGSVGDTKFGIKGPVPEPNGASGWDAGLYRGRTQSGAEYIQADGIGSEASWTAILIDYGDIWQFRVLAEGEEYQRHNIQGWQLAEPSRKIISFPEK